MQNSRSILQIAAALLALDAAAALAQTNVTGILTKSDTGRPISHAIVYAASTTSVTNTRGRLTETAWDGSFIFGNLPAGTYKFCVHNLDIYLNPCEWPTANAATAVQISSSDPKLRLKVDPGRRVYLRVNDSAGLLSTTLATGAKPELVVLIMDQSGKVWRRVPTLGTSTAGHYSLVVPNETTYGFALTSVGVSLADHAGAAIPSLAFIPFPAPLTDAQRALIFQQSHVQPDDPAVVVSIAGLKP